MAMSPKSTKLMIGVNNSNEPKIWQDQRLTSTMEMSPKLARLTLEVYNGDEPNVSKINA